MHDFSLKYFHAVAQTGSLSAASEQLHVAISAISRQISQLEAQLDVTLFERKPRGMSLTSAGEVLYTYSLRNTVELSNVISEMKGLDSVKMQSIALASPEGMAWDFLPYVMACFRAQNPNAIFSLKVVESAEATQLVKEGVVDAALTFSLQIEQGVAVALQSPAPISALLSANHPLANNTQLSVRDLANYPLVLSEPGTTLSYLFDIACHLAGISITPALTTNSMGALYTYAKENTDAIALCGELSVSRIAKRDGLVLIPMQEPSLLQRSIQLQVMSHRKPPSIVQDFLSFLSHMLKNGETSQ
ncbi:LysR family transcriptional regulator [Vibrio zhugei]|uniref:LysR family transcriptional regulator n=1 Tax=Vibrio zhugei TaxID=2479546 RepID=A0ABV7CEP9_9VIBR|nr:LysR family transcriptional regulator [Vibrio zhugei]